LLLAVYLVDAICAAAAPPTSITLDGSLGPAGVVSATSPGFYQITPSMGKTVGPNLFQSFGQFNLGTGDTAQFQANAGTENIIARVTGGSPSSIDGTIESQAPNLFFLNPAGVMFGANAQVNVAGAFTVGTASYLKLSDGSTFYADTAHPLNDAGLTAAPVSAFGFLTATPAPVTFTGTVLNLTPGSAFNVIAGDVTLDNTGIGTQGGIETIFSAASAGEVPFSLANPGAGFSQATNPIFGNVTLQNGSVMSISGATGGGKVVIRGGQMVVQGASTIAAGNYGGTAPGGTIGIQAQSLNLNGANTSIYTTTSGAGAAGDISITASDHVNVYGGLIDSYSTGSGRGGDISIQTGSLTLNGLQAAGNINGIATMSDGSGNGGDISVAVTGTAFILGTAQVQTEAFATGNGGNISVTANSLGMEGLNGQDTGIFSAAQSTAAGNGGNIDVVIQGFLDIAPGGAISANTFGNGNAGSITVQAGSAVITGSEAIGADTGIVSNTFANLEPSADTTGNASTIEVDVAGLLSITGHAQISSATATSGNTGDVTVRAGSLFMDASDTNGEISGIGTDTGILNEPSTGSGNAGNVSVIVTGVVLMSENCTISSNTFSSGNGGNILLDAGTLTIDGSNAPTNVTGILSQTRSIDSTSPGIAGGVTVHVAGEIVLLGAAEINTDTYTAGPAGDIAVTGGTLSISDVTLPDLESGIDSQALGGSGDAGNISVTIAGATSIVSAGKISAATETSGRAGDVTLITGSLFMDGVQTRGYDTVITSSTQGSGNGGNVTVTSAGPIQLVDDAAIAASTAGSGMAGDVTVHGSSLQIQGTGYTSIVIPGAGTRSESTGLFSNSNAGATGGAGNVTVDVPGALTITDGGAISSSAFSTGKAGTVEVQAGSLFVDGVLSFDSFTGISTSSTVDTGAVSAGAGSVTVDVAGTLTLLDSGEISSDTQNSGNAGDVTVQARSIDINGIDTPGLDTGISSSSDSDDTTATGQGGSIHVTAQSLAVLGGGIIEASSFTAGDAGNIFVHAGEVRLDGLNTLQTLTGITTEASYGTGNAGNVTIDANDITLSNRAYIFSASINGNGGDIAINAGTLKLLHHGSIDSQAGLDGGDITLSIGNLLYALKGTISAEASDNGGNITIEGNPQFVVLNGSKITANAAKGRGGNITIEPQDFLNNGSTITATGATAGTITITAPDLNLSGSLLPLPNVLVSDEDRLRESCVRSINHEFSSLVVVGRGGTESAPDELTPDFGVLDSGLPER
jgi:filamentous hemagglutinin family protein